MPTFTASVKLAFVDAFSAKAQQVKANFGGVKTAIKDMGKVNPVFTEFAANMSLVAGQAGNLAQGIQTRLAVPAQLAQNFEAAGARVTTVLTAQNAVQGDTAKSLELLKAAAINNAAGMARAGRLSAMSASEYLNSSFTMLSAGLNTKQAMAATEQSALLAKATGDVASVASSALVGAFNNFGSKTADARVEMTRISDVMATTQQYYAFEDLQGLADGLKNVAGAAIAMGTPFEQLNPLLGQLNTNMIKGPEAGTALKSMMAQLGNASAKLGFDIAKTADGGLDMIQTLENIKAAGASGAELIKAFGTEAGPAVGILTANLEGVKAGFEAIENGAGSSFTGAERAANNLQARVEALSLAKEALNQKMGTGANVVRGWGVSLQSAGVYLGNLLSKVPGLGQGLLSVAGGFGQVASVAVGAASGFFQFSSGIASTMVMAQQLGGVKSIIANSLGATRTVISAVNGGFLLLGKRAIIAGWKTSIAFGAKALGGIKTAASFVFNLGRQFVLAIPKAYAFAVANWAVIGPMLAITVGIAAVIAIGVLLIKHWDTVKAFGAKVWNGIVYGVQTAITWFSNLLNNPFFAGVGVLFAPWITIPALVVKIIMAHWEPIKAFFAAVWDGITLGARAAWGFVVGVFSPVGNAIVAAWQPAKAFFIGMWDAVLFALHSVGAFFNGVFAAIAGRLIAVWQPAKAFFVGMWDAVLLVLQSVGGFFSGTFAAIAQGIITAWQPVKAFFAALFEPINKVVSSASSAWKWLVGGNTEGAGGGQTVPGNVKKFGAGGYTGPGGASQVAGVVHAGEYVFSQSAVDTIGLGNLDYLHKHPGPIQFGQGISAGGPTQSGGGNGNISIHIENLTVNADEIEEIGDFVRLLMRAGGAA